MFQQDQARSLPLFELDPALPLFETLMRPHGMNTATKFCTVIKPDDRKIFARLIISGENFCDAMLTTRSR